MRRYTIYTDGGCRNTGNFKGGHVKKNNKAAYAYKIVDDDNGKAITGTQGFYGKTNNQMEVAAVITALERLVKMMPAGYKFKQEFKLYSDSRYVDDTATKYLPKWIATGKVHKHKNAQLWSQVNMLMKHFSNLSFHWVKGHTDKTDPHHQGNIWCDMTLNQTMDNLK